MGIRNGMFLRAIIAVTSSDKVYLLTCTQKRHKLSLLHGSCTLEGCVLLCISSHSCCTDLILSCIFLCFLFLCLPASNLLAALMPSFPVQSLHCTHSPTSVPEVNGLQEPSLAKRLRGTPERIELENYRLSLQREEELEEVPEETLAEHNLSSVLDKVTDADLGSR